MRIRFPADADLHLPIIKGLRRREPSIDFMTANEAGLAGLDDWAVLALAAANGRALVSHDVSTMPELSHDLSRSTLVPGLFSSLRTYPIVQQSKDYFESGQAQRLLIGKIYWRSFLDELPRVFRGLRS